MEAQTITNRMAELADSADFYMKRGRWNDAERVIVTALKHEPANPSNWLLWSNLGVVRTNREDFNGALQAYEIGLTAAPKSIVLLSNRAWTLLTMGNEADALADLDDTLSVDSLQSWPLKMRGLLYLGKGKYREARRDLSAASRINERDATVFAALADTDAALGLPDDAIADYEKSLSLEQNPEVLFRLLLLMSSNDNLFRKAEERTTDALHKWPTYGEFHLIKALLLKKKYQNDQAEQEKKLAIKYGVNPSLIDSILGPG